MKKRKIRVGELTRPASCFLGYKTSAIIRLRGDYLLKMGFPPGTDVQVQSPSPGVLHLVAI